MPRSASPLETSETRAVAAYLSLLESQGKVEVYTKTAQETWTRSWSQKTKNRLEGVKPGLPDFLIIFPAKAKRDWRLLAIELKRVRGGKVSQAQTKWIEALSCVPGCDATVCHGFDEAKAVIASYL